MTDPIADYLTRVRNAIMAKHEVVEIPASNMKKDITKILYDKGYILGYKFEEDDKQGMIRIALKYHPETKVSAIKSTAPRTEWPGDCHRFHLPGSNDRQGGQENEYRRRDPLFRSLKRRK
jgi:small subunit ribosomal protein S8